MASKERKNGVANDNKTKSDTSWDCKTCSKKITTKVKGTGCSLCPNAFCIECIKMSVEEYEALQTLGRPDVFWLCSDCCQSLTASANNSSKATTDQFDNLRTEFQQKITNLEDTIVKFSTEIKSTMQTMQASFTDDVTNKLSQCAANNTQNITQNITENVTKSFKEALLGTKHQQPEATVSENGLLRDVITEQHEEERKRKEDLSERESNIIIYRAPEEEGKSYEERRIQDITIIRKVMASIDRPDIEPKGYIRLGTFDAEGHKEGKRRPMKIVLYNKESRDAALRNSYKLNESEDAILKEIHIGPDMSKEQKKERDDKIEEAKEKTRNDDGDHFWRVRGPPGRLSMKRVRKREQ